VKLRIVQARTETPGEFRATGAEKVIPPPGNNMQEALNNPTQFRKQVNDQETALRRRDIPATTVRPTDAPAAPQLTDYIRKDK